MDIPSKEIIENNILLAEYDKRMIKEKVKKSFAYQDGIRWNGFVYGEYGNIRSNEHLQYHCSYNWLMPILEQIESENVFTSIVKYHDNSKEGLPNLTELYCCSIGEIDCGYNSNKFESIYLTVVEYLKSKKNVKQRRN